MGLFLVTFSVFTFFGGWEWLVDTLLPLDDEPQTDEDRFYTWPLVIFNWLPLMVPLTLYFVIARWTGDQLYT